MIQTGDMVKIYPGQYLGNHRSKAVLLARVIKTYEWSWLGPTSLLVQCHPRSRAFMVNLKHSKVDKEGAELARQPSISVPVPTSQVEELWANLDWES